MRDPLKIYVACAIHGQHNHFAFRNLVAQRVRELGFEVPKFFSDFAPEERGHLNVYEWDMATVGAANLVCALVDGPSSGVGMELREAHECRVPVLVFTRNLPAVSRIVVDYQKSRQMPLIVVPSGSDEEQASWIASECGRLIRDMVLLEEIKDTSAEHPSMRRILGSGRWQPAPEPR
jgi:hypothetical protein